MYLALRDIRFAKGRFALMGAVVALITFLLVMLSGLTAGLAHQSTSAITELPATTIAFGAPDGTAATASYPESQVSAGQLNTWKAADGVTDAEGLGISQARLEAGGTASIAVFGAAPGGFLAPAGLEPGTAVVSQGVADSLGLSVGKTAEINGTTVQVAGIIEDQWYSHTPVVWVDLAQWQQVAHAPSSSVATVIAANVSPGASGTAADVAAAVDQKAGTLSSSRNASVSALASFQSENGSLTMMQGFLYAISALVIAAFLTVWTVQRTRDIAVLKALGGSSSYILRDALAQAGIVLLVGALAGGGAALAAGAVAAQAVPFQVSAATTLLPALGVVVLGIAASALSVRRAASVDPLLALGGS